LCPANVPANLCAGDWWLLSFVAVVSSYTLLLQLCLFFAVAIVIIILKYFFLPVISLMGLERLAPDFAVPSLSFGFFL
jgi:hypothetical protein